MASQPSLLHEKIGIHCQQQIGGSYDSEFQDVGRGSEEPNSKKR